MNSDKSCLLKENYELRIIKIASYCFNSPDLSSLTRNKDILSISSLHQVYFPFAPFNIQPAKPLVTLNLRNSIRERIRFMRIEQDYML